VSQIDAWIAAGLYDPSADGADDRRELLEFLTDHGATLDDLIDALAGQSLNAAASDRSLDDEKVASRVEAANQCGLTVDEVDRVWRAVGLPPVARDGRVFTESDLFLLGTFKIGVDLLGFDAALQFTRVMGSSLARIADAAVSGFLVNVEGPLVLEERKPVELARASFEATQILKALPQIFAPIFVRHAALATVRTRVTRDQSAGFADLRLTIGFLDLVGYTPWSQDLPAEQLGRAVNEFEEAASDRITDGGGRVIKMIGDAVMYATADLADACSAALDLCGFVDAHPVLTRLRGAITSGVVLSRDGDYFGPTVNLSARAVKLAKPGHVLIDRPVDGFTTVSIGRQTIRGIADAVELFELSR
jgi:adenylate cyclase